ncbi:glyoxalase [Shouchella clausii]|nr:glyoxalase [Shouchella clausii]
MAMEPSLRMITLPVCNLKRALSFYEKALPFQPIKKTIQPDATHAALKVKDGLGLILMLRSEVSRIYGITEKANNGTILTLACESDEEVDAAFAKVAATSAHFIHPRQRDEWSYSFVFSDPDGNLWEVIHIEHL